MKIKLKKSFYLFYFKFSFKKIFELKIRKKIPKNFIYLGICLDIIPKNFRFLGIGVGIGPIPKPTPKT